MRRIRKDAVYVKGYKIPGTKLTYLKLLRRDEKQNWISLVRCECGRAFEIYRRVLTLPVRRFAQACPECREPSVFQKVRQQHMDTLAIGNKFGAYKIEDRKDEMFRGRHRTTITLVCPNDHTKVVGPLVPGRLLKRKYEVCHECSNDISVSPKELALAKHEPWRTELVLRLASEGKTHKAIGELLGVTRQWISYLVKKKGNQEAA